MNDSRFSIFFTDADDLSQLSAEIFQQPITYVGGRPRAFLARLQQHLPHAKPLYEAIDKRGRRFTVFAPQNIYLKDACDEKLSHTTTK